MTEVGGGGGCGCDASQQTFEFTSDSAANDNSISAMAANASKATSNITASESVVNECCASVEFGGSLRGATCRRWTRTAGDGAWNCSVLVESGSRRECGVSKCCVAINVSDVEERGDAGGGGSRRSAERVLMLRNGEEVKKEFDRGKKDSEVVSAAKMRAREEEVGLWGVQNAGRRLLLVSLSGSGVNGSMSNGTNGTNLTIGESAALFNASTNQSNATSNGTAGNVTSATAGADTNTSVALNANATGSNATLVNATAPTANATYATDTSTIELVDLCGDGAVSDGEECDLGADNGVNASCGPDCKCNAHTSLVNTTLAARTEARCVCDRAIAFTASAQESTSEAGRENEISVSMVPSFQPL